MVAIIPDSPYRPYGTSFISPMFLYQVFSPVGVKLQNDIFIEIKGDHSVDKLR